MTRSSWIPWAFVGGMAGVVAVNAVLVVAAVTTFTGTTTGAAYDRGRAYNHVLEEAARQDALGWHGAVTLADGTLHVAVHDQDGRRVEGAVTGVLRRPIEGEELPLALAPDAVGWTAAVAPRAGQWEARLTLTDAAGHRFDLRQRVFAP